MPTPIEKETSCLLNSFNLQNKKGFWEAVTLNAAMKLDVLLSLTHSQAY